MFTCFDTIARDTNQSDSNASSCVKVTPVFRERRDQEGFLASLACPAPPEAVDPRGTEALTETRADPASAWRGPGVPRGLTEPRDPQVLESLDPRVSEAPLENKVSAV